MPKIKSAVMCRNVLVAVLALSAPAALSAAGARVEIEPASAGRGPQTPGTGVTAPVIQPLTLNTLSLPGNLAPVPFISLPVALPPPPTATPALRPSRTSPAPAETPLESLRSAGAELTASPQDDAGTLNRLFEAQSLDAPASDAPTAEESIGAREKKNIFRRLRKGRGDALREEFLPFLDVLWQKGLLGEADLRAWDENLSGKGLHATRREDVFRLLSQKVSPENWPLDKPWPAELLLWAYGEHGSSLHMRAKLAGNPASPEALLRVLAEDRDATVRAWVAHNPATPPDVLRILARDSGDTGDSRVLEYAAGNESTPSDALAELLTAYDGRAKLQLQRNRSLPASVLAQLAATSDGELCRFVAGCAAAPAELLRTLADNPLMRYTVARNEAAPADVLRKLRFDADPDVLLAVASNPSTPPDILRELYVEHPRRRADRLHSSWHLHLARNPTTPRDILDSLARSRSWGVRLAAAKNPSASREALGKLLRDGEQQVRRAAAEHPSLTRKDPPRLDDADLRRLVAAVKKIIQAEEARPLKDIGLLRGAAPSANHVADASASNPAAVDFTSLLSQQEAAPQLAFANIVFDVRNSRGGHGDVAAAWLTATDILERLSRSRAPPPRITFIVDASAMGILTRLLDRPIEPGATAFEDKIRFETPRSLPAAFPIADLYLTLASPSGSLRNRDSMTGNPRLRRALLRLGKFFPRLLPFAEKIPVGKGTVFITQTVLGNTENPDSKNPYGLMQLDRRALRLLPAGLASRESGVYSDPVAWRLRGRSKEELRGFLLERLDAMDNRADAQMLRGIVTGERLSGALPALAYGISADSVKPQFESYLSGLAHDAAALGRSYVLMTPSQFFASELKDAALRERVRVISDADQLDASAEPGTIYVVKANTLPHAVFIGLMAYSRVPPVLAGDGAMSAAIVLGRPFVMTQVAWNARNLASLRERLDAHTDDPQEKNVLQAVYGELDLSRALELSRYAAGFERLGGQVPGLTDHLLAAARTALLLGRKSLPTNELIAAIADPVLKLDVMISRAFDGDRQARAHLERELERRESARAEILAASRRLPGGLSASWRRLVNRVSPLPFRRFFSRLAPSRPDAADTQPFTTAQ